MVQSVWGNESCISDTLSYLLVRLPHTKISVNWVSRSPFCQIHTSDRLYQAFLWHKLSPYIHSVRPGRGGGDNGFVPLTSTSSFPSGKLIHNIFLMKSKNNFNTYKRMVAKIKYNNFYASSLIVRAQKILAFVTARNHISYHISYPTQIYPSFSRDTFHIWAWIMFFSFHQSSTFDKL